MVPHKNISQFAEVGGFFKARLIQAHKVAFYIRLHPVDAIAPLPQPFHFQRHVKSGLSFALGEANYLAVVSTKKSGPWPAIFPSGSM